MNPLFRFWRSQPNLDFPALWRILLRASALLLVVSVVAIGVRGLNLGIEFEGGTVWEVRAPGVSTSEVRDALSSVGQADAKIQIAGGDLVRVRAELDVTDATDVAVVSQVLADLVSGTLDDVSFNSISASWGSEITERAVRALIVFFIVVAIYITLRLEWRMAVAALLAVAHDILITVGIYALFQLEVTPATVIAFLTIMGYSLYDTIVVFDKARDFHRHSALTGKATYTRIMNAALNTVLLRSVNTTITSVLPVLSMLIIGAVVLGAVTLAEFSVALLIGLLVGTYSSLFVAAPVVTWLKERSPEFTEVRERLEGRARSRGTSVAEQEDLGGSPKTSTPAPQSSTRRRPTQSPGTTIAPRPRKRKGR